MPVDLASIKINRQHSIPLSRQLYVQLHHQILQGKIIFKESLPASRVMASELKISRGVVVESYDMLKIDGLVAGFGKSGTQVSYKTSAPNPPHAPRQSSMMLSRRGKRIASARHYAETLLEPLPLTPGVPDFSLFPLARWHSLSREALTTAPSWYQRDGGVSLLKRTLMDYLAQYRGLHVKNPQQLLITSGSQSALGLLARLLTEPGDSALLETPGWSGAEGAMLQACLKIHSIPVDEQGSQLDKLKLGQAQKTPRIAVTSPAIQFPTGCPMSLQRQLSLLEYTASNQCWLIEDDYAAEYSYSQHPAPSIMAHSFSDHVIHVGTMSKLLMPALRIGWMVVPQHIAQQVNQALNTSGIIPSYLLQQQLGLFMQYGYLSTHLAQTRTVYNDRHGKSSRYLQQHAERYLARTTSISGMNQYLKINTQSVDISDLSKRLSDARLGCEVYQQNINNQVKYFLLLGHANLNDEVMKQHLDQLISVVSKDSMNKPS